MKINLRRTMLGCTVWLAAAANAQTTEFNLGISSVSSPRTCVLTKQPVTLTVRNSGKGSVETFTVGVMKNGVKLFEEKKDTTVASYKTVVLTLDNTVDLEYGKTDTLTIWAKGDGTDTNEANDTTTLVVAMPPMKSFPYTWDASTAESEFTTNKWSYDATQSRYYVYGKSTNVKNATLTTPGIQMTEGGNVTCTYKYHTSAEGFTFMIIADYGTEKDTVYNDMLPLTSGDNMVDNQVSFTAKGVGQLQFKIAGVPSGTNEMWLSDINLSEAVPDLAAVEITSPAINRLVRQEQGYTVSVRYANRSPFEITNPTLCYQAGDSKVTETYEGTLTEGDEINYTFKTLLNAGTADEIELTAWCEAEGDGNLSNDTVSASYAFYEALDFPYTTKFDEGNDLWQTIDADGDGSTWTFSTLSATGGCAYYPTTSNADAADYLVSPAIKMPAGRSRISFYYSGYMQKGTENLSVMLSTTPDTTGIKKTLFNKDLTNNGWLNGFSLIDLDEAGTYYFLFRATGSNDRIYIDNLYIDQNEDLCINDVTFDTESGFNKKTSKVTLSFMNHGVTAQKDVTVRYYINEVQTDEQTIAETVEPGDTLYYTFEKAADISASDSTYMLKGKIVTVLGPDQDNDSIYGQSVSHWADQHLPYYYGFDDTDRNTYWLMESDTEGTKSKWTCNKASSNAYSTSYALKHTGKVTAGTNDWAYSECLDLPKGRYEMSFFYRTSINSNKDTNKKDISVSLGTDRTPDAMTMNIVSLEDVLVPGQFYKKFTGTLNVEEDGKYFLGFCCNTSDCSTSAALFIDDIEIKAPEKGRPLPYTADFNDGWTKYNPRQMNPCWTSYTESDSTKVMRVERTQNHSVMNYGFEDKLVSPKLYIESGKKVIMTVNYALSSDSTNTAIDIFTGHIDNPDSLELVASMPVVADSAYTAYEYTFTPTEADSAFYVGFRTNSPVDGAAGYIYDARIKSVVLDYDHTSGIGNISTDNAVAINVRNGRMSVTSTSAIGRIEVFDLSGRTVMSATSALNSISLDCSGLQGIYIVKASTASGTVVKKIRL